MWDSEPSGYVIDNGLVTGGLAYAEEMQRNAKDDVQLRPRAHVFLALMRAFAERGDVTMVGSLRSRLIPEAAGHVWPEDRAEADELYIEAAVLAGQVKMSFHNHLICWLFLSAKFAVESRMSHFESSLVVIFVTVMECCMSM